MSRQEVGLVTFAGIVAVGVWSLADRWQGAITMMLASNVLMVGFFLVTTRMHEHYLFSVVARDVLLAVLDSRCWR